MMKNLTAIGLTLALVLASAGPSLATTWHVNTAGTGDAPTIAAGIDSAAAGDTVEVACGTYYEHAILMKPDVVLRSETGKPDCVTIDGEAINLIMYFTSGGSSTVIEGLTITNGANQWGGGMRCLSASPTISNCVFENNHAILVTQTPYGGAIEFENSSANVTDCVFRDNTSWQGGGVYVYESNVTMTRCTFVGNSCSQWSSAAHCYGYTGVPTFVSCTFVDNGPPEAIRVQNCNVQLDNCIIAFTVGGASVDYYNAGTLTATCTDVYGNAGGDWVSVLAGQLGSSGNIQEDPLFCDAGAGDFHLQAGSACLGASCGTIGAFGLGCGEAAVIASIADVLGDQGGQVRIKWERSGWDAPGDTIDVVEYEVHRRQDAFAVSAPERVSEQKALFNGWDYLGSVPAHGDSIYQMVVPTLCDSTISGGMCWSVFMIRTTTTDRFLYFNSDPDSGYSVDNLAPAVPAAFTVAYNQPGGNQLAWAASEEEDLKYYRVYRSTDAGFVPGPGNLVHSTTSESWTDPESEGWRYFYKITALDFAGNESPPAGPNSATGAGGTTIPKAFALYQNVPNPFNPVTTIRYDVPEGGAGVTLRVYDVQGALVRTLVDGPQAAGEQAAVWDGRNRRGEKVASGIYFYRLEGPGFEETRKMVLVE